MLSMFVILATNLFSIAASGDRDMPMSHLIWLLAVRYWAIRVFVGFERLLYRLQDLCVDTRWRTTETIV